VKSKVKKPTIRTFIPFYRYYLNENMKLGLKKNEKFQANIKNLTFARMMVLVHSTHCFIADETTKQMFLLFKDRQYATTK